MEKWFEASATSLWAIVISAVAIYIAVIILTKIIGKRSFSKMSSFDFANTIAIGSIIGSTILLKNVSLLQGFVGLLIVFVLQWLVAVLRRFSVFQKIVDNQPLLLMDGAEIIHENLKKANVTETDLRSKLREANVIRLEQVKAVIFETTGDISVLHSNEPSISVENWLLKDVKK